MGRLSLRLGRRPTSAPPALGDGLIAEHFGAGAILSHPADPPYKYWRALRMVAGATDEPLVSMSAGAGTHLDAGNLLCDLVRNTVRTARTRHSRVWLVCPGLDATARDGVGWLVALSRAAGVDIVAADGPIAFLPDGRLYAGPATGATGWRTFHPHGAGDRIGEHYPSSGQLPEWPPLESEAAPATLVSDRWRRRDTRIWLLGDAEPVVAEAVPAGILLRPLGLYSSDAYLSVDPMSSTITVGTAGFPVPAALVAAVRRLVDETTTGQAGGLKLRVAGEVELTMLEVLGDLVGEWATVGEAAYVATRPQTSDVPSPLPEAPVGPTVPAMAPVELRQAARYQEIVTMSATPVVTVAEPVTEERPPEAPSDPGEVRRDPPAAPSPAIPPASTASPAPVPAPAAPPGLPAPAPVVHVHDRASTAAEQREFVAALGAEFTGTLATVNAALSTWPALRDDSPGAKADYAAVCVYLGRTDWGGVRLNAALRAGRLPDLAGYLPCLVSGMRRLPLHRRAVLCQATLGGPVERSYPVGATLTEPTFRSASAGLDVAVPGADIDLLIWSRSARQTSVLGSPDRPLDEATFLSGTRFKVLEVRRSKPGGGDGAELPAVTVLLREVSPGERTGMTGLDEADRVALSRLTRALAQRRSQSPRVVEDVDLVERLAGPALGAGVADGAMACS
ncbi:hypothetical protein HCA58_22555 [Micromonospora sp. HNM0581]|uniref:hypothetical protein n=1 Tax=Micromonospora sp. HNM0581 TaxID=2716341 RepID=UPI00146D414E|nr:hypothetical protein [Micromonospora sp. HNM0581]NLU81075.1 hypothetical protein [Micromonospora sp. HNM0581]